MKLLIRDASIIGYSQAPCNLGDRVRTAGRPGTIAHRNADHYKVRLDGGHHTTWLTRDQLAPITT